MENIRDFLLNESVEPGLESFVAGFFEDRKGDFENLKVLVASGDLEAAGKITHNWKGYCKPYGFETLGLLAKEIEDAIAANNKDEINKLLVSVDMYLKEKGILIAEG